MRWRLVADEERWRSVADERALALGGRPVSGALVRRLPWRLWVTGLLALSLSAPLALADARLANIATRGVVGTGDNVLIAGFVIRGHVPQTVVLRAVGPSIDTQYVPLADQLADPVLELFSVVGESIARNDNWADAERAVDIPQALQPAHGAEAALVVTLPPGAYTAVVSGARGTTGVGLVEVFEVADGQASGAPRLVNLSTRVRVETGDRVAIGGLIVAGGPARTYVVRARSSSIPPAAVAPADLLPDPVLQLFTGSTLIDANDNWQDHPAASSVPSSLAPTHPEEAAMLVTLDAGAYTGVVSGVDGGQGVAIVEVIEVTEDLPDLDAGPQLPLESLNVPDGFALSVFARVTNARQMALSESGTLYVGSFEAGQVSAVQDRDFDGRADAHFVIDTGLDNPTGVAWRDGDLFVAAVNRILRYRDIENRLDDPPEPEVVTASLPTDAHHGWKVLGFGPDGLLYTNVGAPCNVCLRDEIYATIVRLDVDSLGPPASRSSRRACATPWASTGTR